MLHPVWNIKEIYSTVPPIKESAIFLGIKLNPEVITGCNRV